ncbi:RCC1 domain-containing protein [Pseudomonas lini]
MTLQLNASSTDDVAPLTLRPPIFPASTQMVDPEHYHRGIPIRAVEGDLLTVIPSWNPMSIGDLVEMFWGNAMTPVKSKSIEEDSELDQEVVFRIAQGFITEGEVTPVFYRITRLHQAPESSTPILVMLVKLNRPGGFDDSPEEGHSGLRYTLIPDVSQGVDPGMAEKGVQMRVEPYENITVFDRIIARWGGQEVVHYPVTQEQIDDPINHPILITFTKGVIEDAGDGPRVAVTFQVIDRCGNYPDERAPWATISYVLVDLGGNRLAPPLVLVEGKPVNSVDLEQLGEDDVTVRVYTNDVDFAVGDKVRMTWTGAPAEGSPVIVGPLEQIVEFVPFQCDFTIPNAAVRAIAKGWASVGYVRVRDGVVDRPSKNASVTVSGEIERLPAPGVQEAPQGHLDPSVRWATVEIPWFPGRQASDLMTLIWEATRPGGGTVYYEDPRPVGNVPDGEPVLRNVSNVEIQRFDGLKVSVYYRVANDDESILSVRESLPFLMQVGDVLPQFEVPRVVEVAPGSTVLDPVAVPPVGFTLIVPHKLTLAGDRVTYRVRGSGSEGSTSDYIDLTSQTAGKEVRFTVPKQYVTNNLNRRIVVDYFIVRDGKTLGYSFELTLRVGDALLDFDPPSIDGARGDQLDASAVPGVGATVRIPAAYALMVGDSGEIRWTGTPGAGTVIVPFRVEAGEAGRDKLVTVPRAAVLANIGREISLDCTVLRQAGGRQYSRVAVYDVRETVGSGRLLVMGARSRGGYQQFGGGYLWLTALDAVTRQPIKAWWRYNGEATEISGTTFRDTRPDRLLHVRVADDQVTINAKNLIGNGNLVSGSEKRYAAFAARTDRGELVAWGHTLRGGDLGADIPQLTDFVAVIPCGYAFCGCRTNGSVVAWGYYDTGGVVPESIARLRDIRAVTGNGYAFAAQRMDGSVVAWGAEAQGNLPAPIASLRDIATVTGSTYAFAALRSNGQVVAWGSPDSGGVVPDEIAVLNDLEEITGCHRAFAARRANGSVVAWGYHSEGGTVPARIADLKDILEVCSSLRAFAARRENGSVVAWGHAGFGGAVPPEIERLTDIVQIFGNSEAFAALRANGSVVAWGNATKGGVVPNEIGALTDIVQIACNPYAFVALRANGAVVAWGHYYGQIPAPIAPQLFNVRAIYSNTHAFAALTSDRRVVTWGINGAGGDSIADQLNGKVSYEATPASRGLGLRESRLAADSALVPDMSE